MEAGVVESAQRKERIECSVLVVEVEVAAGWWPWTSVIRGWRWWCRKSIRS